MSHELTKRNKKIYLLSRGLKPREIKTLLKLKMSNVRMWQIIQQEKNKLKKVEEK